uniref:ornithine decarboxylase n=1 Tax=Globodera pallida TaxID=36090 RepID=A0A183BX92_GLOPA
MDQQNYIFITNDQTSDKEIVAAHSIVNKFEKKIEERSFTIVNLNKVVCRHRKWCELLPNVKPFYAVKCNNDPFLLRTLATLGVGFDCASLSELKLALNVVPSAEHVLFAHTCKFRQHIEFADNNNIRRMTFDSAQELGKIKQYHTKPELLLRIGVQDRAALFPLDTKFGCDPVEKSDELLILARAMDIKVIGISFHVGSACRNPKVYRKAIRQAKRLFEFGKEIGHQMHVLDLGGGFPGVESDDHLFEQMAKTIRAALADYFPIGASSEIEVIAEPGRFFATSACSICVEIVGKKSVSAALVTKRKKERNEIGYMYFVNDGVHGSLCTKYCTKGAEGLPILIQQKDTASQQQYHSIVYGPTCDSRDIVEGPKLMPELECGDRLLYREMGAYTFALSTNFNGFYAPQFSVYLCSADLVKEIAKQKL